ncbi:hypothetical protein M501DRAFT_1016034 [Patellaria atrata CBS 101060]|uniref:F-box domain-containing protein n=1 Tax=Patellaria atrata CBS 101060 TaxID=1346257 RepID=A0A9P4SDR3_9PEZI|nr:hypothetical protein M501DRAFT_1016034 [Patellaria atrata CBS 101060]
MDLTPVHIRGKKRPRTNADSGQNTIKRSRGRPPKAPKAEPALKLSGTSSTVLSASEKLQKRRKPRRPLSRLEQLPNEIIQTIFLESQNVDLPGCSPHLTRVLNSEHMYLEFCVQTYLKEDDEDGQFWFPISRGLPQRRFFTFQFWGKLENRLVSTIELLRANGDDIEALKYWAYEIPVKLLSGPWKTNESLDEDQNFKFLSDLHRKKLWPPLEGKGVMQAMIQGIRNAVMCNNQRVFNILISFGLHFDLYEGTKDFTELIRYAVIECGCNEDMVGPLLRHSPVTFDYMDPELWAWVERNKDTGNGKGEWLMEILRLT